MLETLRKAIAQREVLRASTDALRIVDGRGDGFADLEIDDFAGHWLVQTKAEKFPEWLRESGDSLPARALYWKKLGEKNVPVWMAGEKISAPFKVRENGVGYEIDFAAGYSQGLFLDQRDNRQKLREISAGKRVLNCFAYTCGFGVCAAMGGAKTVNVDLSKRYLAWGRRNYALNNVDPAAHEFLHGDVANWLERFARKEWLFDIVVLDPPTFSRDDRGRVFTIEQNFAELVRAATKILAPDGALFCSTNQRSLSLAQFRRLIFDGLDAPSRWNFASAPMPPDFRGEQYLKSCWLQRDFPM